MPTTPAHTPDHATYSTVRTTTSHGLRYRFDCPSSRDGHPPHQLWVGGGGEEPSCTCPGFATHKHCGLTDGALVLLRGMYAARAARASDGVLWATDREQARKCAAGTLTAQDRLVWDACGDAIAARCVAALGWAQRTAAAS